METQRVELYMAIVEAIGCIVVIVVVAVVVVCVVVVVAAVVVVAVVVDGCDADDHLIQSTYSFLACKGKKTIGTICRYVL